MIVNETTLHERPVRQKLTTKGNCTSFNNELYNVKDLKLPMNNFGPDLLTKHWTINCYDIQQQTTELQAPELRQTHGVCKTLKMVAGTKPSF